MTTTIRANARAILGNEWHLQRHHSTINLPHVPVA